MPRLQSASSADRMTERRTLAAIRKEPADARRPSNCCAKKEASAPPRVDVSTDPWRVRHGATPPSPVQSELREGFKRLTFLTKMIRERDALKLDGKQEDRPHIRA